VRHVNTPVQVTTIQDPVYPDPRPTWFKYHGSMIRIVQVQDHWREAGRWWEQEPDSAAWRVTDSAGGVYELLMLRTKPPNWRLMVIYD
jgi:hypothetical protein